MISEILSGIVVYQTGVYNPFLYQPITPSQTTYYQEFNLPNDFLRSDTQPANGATTVPPEILNPPEDKLDETVTIENDRFIRTIAPPITGFQISVGIDAGFASTAAVGWTLEHYDDVAGWKTLASGDQVGAHSDGDEVWFDIFFDEPVPIKIAQANDLYRMGITPYRHPNPVYKVLITKRGEYAILPDGAKIWLGYLYPDSVVYAADALGFPIVFYVDPTGALYYSHYHGINKIWLSLTNPWNAYTNAGPIQYQNGNAAFKFRILAGIAHTGKDILNNPSRDLVINNSASNLDTFKDKTASDFWLSKPNPSQFGVETLYFDISQDDGPTVFDNIYLDPLTPGIYCNVYYSNDPNPGQDVLSWDSLFWSYVTQFRLDRAQNYVMPNPVTARYVALEFVQLQAKEYDPGEFNLPIRYRKHPKWVLDYFVLRLSQKVSEDHFVPTAVQVDYDALSFAYNYYLDDVQQQPEDFVALSSSANTNTLQQFLTDQSDTADKVDPATLNRISLVMQQFQTPPGSTNPTGSILSQIAALNTSGNYPVETVPNLPPVSSDVSSLDRDALILDKSSPVMFFYVTSRHLYREVSAVLTYNRAYFAGLKNVAFTRNRYTVRADDPIYIEGVGDTTNCEILDYVTASDFSWATHS